jgi:hypothetical protein
MTQWQAYHKPTSTWHDCEVLKIFSNNMAKIDAPSKIGPKGTIWFLHQKFLRIKPDNSGFEAWYETFKETNKSQKLSSKALS